MVNWLGKLILWPTRLPIADGGGGGASSRQAEEELAKQQAIAKVNQYFGVPMTSTTQTVQQPVMTPTFSGVGDRNQSVGPPTGSIQTGTMPVTTTVPLASDPVADANRAARDALYGKTREDVVALNRDDLDRQYANAARATKFFLAGRGLTGGSEDVDKNAELERLNQAGIRTASQAGERAANELESADESSRLGIIDRILSGADQATSIQNANNALADNARRLAGTAYGSEVGNAFNSLTSIYGSQQDALGAEDAAARYKRLISAVAPQPKASSGTLGAV